MGKVILYALFIITIILISFFGLGPVLFADGAASERWSTLILVLVIYLVAIITFIAARKRINRNDSKEK